LTSFRRQINLFDLSKYLKGNATDINLLYVAGQLFECHVRQLPIWRPYKVLPQFFVQFVMLETKNKNNK